MDFFLHLDRHLAVLLQNYGAWSYFFLFIIIFCETGLVVTPILPGDSLLFAAGTLAAGGALNPLWLFGLLSIAAIAGDTVNYWIGYGVGERVFEGNRFRFLNKNHLTKAHQFYERYGGKTIVLARFIPIIRTFAPFVAGVARMTYRRFIVYNLAGGIAWISIFVFGGYLFGQLPAVQKNFSLVILSIIAISVAPAILEFLRHRKSPRP